MKSLKYTFSILILFFFINSNTLAQATHPMENGEVLEGIWKFDASVAVQVFDDVGYDQETFRRNLNDEFRLGLRRDGVIVDEGAPNYLYCSVRVLNYHDMIVIYNIDIDYFSYEVQGVHNLLWTKGIIGGTGRNKFTTETISKECVDLFSGEWLKWNPGR